VNAPPPPLTKNMNFGALPLPKNLKFNPGGQKNTFFYALIAVLVVVVVMVMNKSSDQHKFLKIKDPTVSDQELENINENNEKREQEILKKGKDTQAYYDAQGFYLRGFREYREGNYLRAVQNFQAALALYPNHQLARKYLDRSKVKNDEQVTSALERAEKDFELERYNNAYSEYRTVLLLSNDPKSEKFRLARKRMEAIELIFANSK
jgi:tetratricopeptide (TPR) repeat protein